MGDAGGEEDVEGGVRCRGSLELGPPSVPWQQLADLGLRWRLAPPVDLRLDRTADIAHRAGEIAHGFRIAEHLAAEHFAVHVAAGAHHGSSGRGHYPVKAGRSGVIQAVYKLIGVAVYGGKIDQRAADKAFAGSDGARNADDERHKGNPREPIMRVCR